MSRRAVLIVLFLCAVAALTTFPVVRPYYTKWHTHLEEIPLAGATVSYREFGRGGPVVVIISGMSVPKDSYLDLQKRLSGKARVITYDRPGIGASTPNSEPRTLDYIDKDLKSLLHALGAPPPYILVGHSLGGHIIRYFASRHPGEVAGLVFLDAPHEDWFEYVRKNWSKEDADKYFQWWTADNEEYAGVRLEEMLAYGTNCDMIRGVNIQPDVPVLMFTSSNFGHFRKTEPGLAEDRRNWAELQASLLPAVKDKKHLVNMQLSHWLHVERPEWVAGEIGAFVEKVRQERDSSPGRVSPPTPAPESGIAAPSVSSP